MNVTRQWTCSCRSVNGLRHKACPLCGKAIPAEVCQKVYSEELAMQKQAVADELRRRHNRFWQRNEGKIHRGAKLCRFISLVLVAVFIGSFYGHSSQIRAEDLDSRWSAVSQAVVQRVESTDFETREGEVSITLFERFAELDVDGLNKCFSEIIALFEQRIEQIFNTKEN